jgi:membrane associated rhomboid family serine protease
MSSEQQIAIPLSQKPKLSASLSKFASDFRPVFITFVMIFIVSALFLISSLIYPHFNDLVVASGRTPWGVVTSIFAHLGIEHFTVNMTGIFAYFLVFAVCNSYLSAGEKRQRITFFIIASFSATVIANLLWVILKPQTKSLGASGLFYACEGIVMMLALFNGLNLFNLKTFQTRNKFSKIMIECNLLVGMVLILEILVSPSAFLNVEPGVNAGVHGLAFLLGVVFTAVFIHWTLQKKVNTAEENPLSARA